PASSVRLPWNEHRDLHERSARDSAIHPCACGGNCTRRARDVAEGVTWIRKAADQGDVEGQVSLGLMYEEAKGVVKDEAEALKWYRKAADQGHAGARNRVIALQKKFEAEKGGRSAAATQDRLQWQQQMDQARRDA